VAAAPPSSGSGPFGGTAGCGAVPEGGFRGGGRRRFGVVRALRTAMTSRRRLSILLITGSYQQSARATIGALAWIALPATWQQIGAVRT